MGVRRPSTGNAPVEWQGKEAPMTTLLAAEAKSAGGAALGEVFIGTAIFVVLFAVTITLAYRQRHGKSSIIGWAGDRISHINNIPPWATFPQVFLTGSLLVAVFGMYWDISLHIGQGRDPGPLANPAHYWILFGLFGIVASGVASASLGEGPVAGPDRSRSRRTGGYRWGRWPSPSAAASRSAGSRSTTSGTASSARTSPCSGRRTSCSSAAPGCPRSAATCCSSRATRPRPGGVKAQRASARSPSWRRC